MSKDHDRIDQGRRDLLRGRVAANQAGAPEPEAHIASLLVQARPDELAAVIEKIGRLPGAEVHDSTRRGKVLVTLESDSQGQIADGLNRIQNIRGVISAALVYHQVDALDDQQPHQEGQRTP